MTKGRSTLVIAVLIGLLGLGTWIADKPPWTQADSAAVEPAEEATDEPQALASSQPEEKAEEAPASDVADGAELSADAGETVTQDAPASESVAELDEGTEGAANIAETVGEQATNLVDSVTEDAGEVATKVVEEATALAETASEQAAAIADDAAETAEAAANAVAEAVEAAPETLSNAADAVAEVVEAAPESISQAATAVAETASEARESLTGVVESVTGAAKQAADGVVGAISGDATSDATDAAEESVADLNEGDTASDALASSGTDVAEQIDPNASDIADIADGAAEQVTDAGSNLTNEAEEAADDLVAALTDGAGSDTSTGQEAADGADAVVEGVVEDAVSVAETASEAATEAISDVTPQVAALPSTGTAAVEETVGEDAPAIVEPALSNPKFDALRVNQFGDLVVAGQAAPNSTVTILDGQQVVGTVVADARGDWVFLPESALEPGNYELTVRAEAEAETLESDDAIVLVVPERGKTIAGEDVQNQAEDGSLALLVSRDELDASRVLQAPAAPDDRQSGKVETDAAELPDEKPAVAEVDPSVEKTAPAQAADPEPVQVAINTIDYDEKGDVVVAGQATADSEVRLYVDDQLAGSATADTEGEYVVEPDTDIAAGDYTLRVDQVDGEGAVESRAAIPFTRATVEQVEQVASLPGSVTVQPGNSLWRIARRVYGQGIRYTVIYQANAEQIRDPDLIYPGQIFVLPEGREEG